MNKQVTPRRDARKQAAVAKRLPRTIAQHVIDGTVKVDSKKAIIRGRCKKSFRRGNAIVRRDQVFYLVASKFEGRYYVVNEQGDCSALEDAVACGCRAVVALRTLQDAA